MPANNQRLDLVPGDYARSVEKITVNRRAVGRKYPASCDTKLHSNRN